MSLRRGLPPKSVVSVTGLPVTPAIEAMRARGVLDRLPMFSEILEDGVRWPDGTVVRADVILWCTGFLSSLDHLAHGIWCLVAAITARSAGTAEESGSVRACG